MINIINRKFMQITILSRREITSNDLMPSQTRITT